jgi:hypothetical protein
MSISIISYHVQFLHMRDVFADAKEVEELSDLESMAEISIFLAG